MKQWVSLLKDRVSFSPSSPTTSSPRQWSSPKSSSDGDTPKSRRKGYETEQELRTFWEEFRSSSSEKEKEEALEIVIEIFCKLCRKHGNPFEIINRLGDPRLFSFVLARSFVNDIERLKNSSPSCQLVLHDILHIFSGKGKEEEGRVSGLLYALENVIIPPLDVQPLLDAGLLSCMVAVLHTFVPSSGQGRNTEGLQQHNMEDDIDNVHPISRLQGGLIHIMKTLARHKGAVQSLEDTDSLELLFHMVVINNHGQTTLHMLQLQRHVMQIISSLLSTDDGGIGLYIHNRQLVKVLLKAVKDYEEENGDPAYVVGVVSLLLDCIQLSYRPGASGVKLREDFQNAHGYHLLAQLALKFSSSELWKSGGNDNQSARDKLALQTSDLASAIDTGIRKRLSPALLSLLDVLVEFTQVGTVDDYVTASAAKAGSCMPRFEQPKPSASERVAGDNKVRDVFAVQVLQDIFLKSGDLSLQIEVLDRLLRLLAGHPANYLVVQDLRILSLFVLNMANFPEVLQAQLLKVLEYVVTVVSLVPEQELLALCCLLQQPLSGSLSRSILLFFVKVLSFDIQYKKVLREVGLLDIIIEDVKKCMEAADVQSRLLIEMQGCTESMSTIEQANGKSCLFMRESTRSIAWDCLLSLIRQNEANQAAFRKSNSVVSILPLLSSSLHRQYVLRVLSTLITEDKTQSHPEDMNSLIKIINSGGIVTISGRQWQVSIAAQTDILWMMWRILSSNSVLKNSFGEEGFMLLLSSFQNFHSEADKGANDISIKVQIDLLTALFHLVTIAVSDHPLNRIKLREVINSGSFREYVLNCSLVASEYEGHFLDLLFDLALEHNRSPVKKNEACNILSIGANIEEVYVQDYTPDIEVDEVIEGKEIFNGTVIIALIMLLPRVSSESQIKILRNVELLVRRSMCNRECLSNIGVIHLLLEMLPPTASYPATIWSPILQIVKLVGSYRLSSLELRKLLRYIWQWRDASAGDTGSRFVGMMEGILYADDGLSQLASSIKFHVDCHRHACVHISLGERYWPPAGGYSFACWFRYEGFSKKSLAEHHGPVSSKFQPDNIKLNIFSVECVDSKNITLLELSLNDMGILSLSTSVNSQLVFKGVHLEEGLWYHLAIVHNKPNVLAGLFQSSLANLYVNGCLRFTGKLGYTASSTGRALQSLLGSSSSLSAGSSTWQINGCYLFEEVLAAPAIYLMYILGRGYHGLFQDIDLLRFVPYEACGGENLAILETIETASSSVQKGDKLSTYKITGSVWELERLALFWSQLSTKKMIFAFDGTPSDPNSIVSITNLVDPLSAAASPLGGLPRIGRLSGNVSILRPCSLGDSIRTIGGVAVVLALVEAAQTPEMLHLALLLLVRVMHCNPRNAYDLLACRGYHLLALFLHRRMEILGLQDLELLFQIAACEASVAASRGILEHTGSGHSAGSVFEASLESISLATVSEDQASSLGSPSDMVDSFGQDAATCMSELGVAESPHESLNCIVLSNPDMMEYVLLDWTIWGTASLPIQLALLNFIERLVAMHRYRNHNLTTLRSLNIIQHLLVTLQRMDIEIPVAEKLVVLLGILLEDGFLTFELKHVADFVVMTFDPPGVVDGKSIPRESMGMQVIVRNILLEMLIDLQTTIYTEEILDTWHKLVSSRLVTFLLDEAVHPTTLRWVMTLLGVCMSSSQAFAVKFRTSGGYQALKQVLPSFYDSPDVYYVLFCLLFGRAVYPRKPEVRMLDFLAFMPNDGGTEEIQFVDLLDSILAMSKAAFDRMSQKSKSAQEMGEFSYMEELLDSTETSGELQGEALLHKTYAARLMGGEAAAPSMVTSILRFMVDLAKMCRPFSTAFRRHELLEDCVDLYFSCARSAFAVRATKGNQPVILTDQSIEMPIQKDDENTSSNIAAASNLSTFGKGKSMTDSTGYAEKSPGNTLSNGSISKAQNPNIFQYSRISALSDSEYYGKGEESLFSSSSFSESSSSRFVTLPLSPASSDKAGANEANLEHRSSMPSMKSVVPGSPTFGGIASWLGNSWTEGRSQSASASLVNVPSTPYSDVGHDASTVAEVEASVLTVDMLVELDAAGSGGGPFSGGAAAVLDLIAEVLADALTDQPKAALAVESALEAVPLSVRPEVALTFQGLCLNRMMNFLERRLLRDEEGGGKKLDKSRWSANLETFSALVVDRLYMGAFTDRAGPLKVLEFLLAMLQLANKDGRVEEASPARGLLSLARGGSRPADPFIISLLKNTNRTVMYCFLFPACGDPDDEVEQSRNKSEKAGLKPTGVDIVTVLQLLMANKSLIFCANNVDREFVQSLLYNVVPMLQMERQAARMLALDVCKAILIYRREVLEDVLVLKGNQGELVDMLHGGFDKLLLNNGIEFFTWFDDFQSTLQRILNRRCSATWMEFIAGTARFPDMRIKSMETRRKRELMRRSREVARIMARHWDQMVERRVALDLVRETLQAEIRAMRQLKYGWVIHADSEWQGHLQQLMHERGLWPARKYTENVGWYLCSTEGPYRMRKRLLRSKPKDTVSGKVADDDASNKEVEPNNRPGVSTDIENPDYDSFFHLFSLFSESPKEFSEPSKDLFDAFDDDSESRGLDEYHSSSSKTGVYDDQSSNNETETQLSGPSRKLGVTVPESSPSEIVTSVPGSVIPEMLRPNMAIENGRVDNDLHDNGEYLITPYLERGEKLKFKYNCERVVGLDKHDGVFLIGEICLYVIENFYIDKTGHICEKTEENEISVLDQVLGVITNTASAEEVKQMDTTAMATWPGGKAWAYHGGSWRKDSVSATCHMPHSWRKWKLDSVQELLKRQYQLRPVAIELFSMDGCNDLLIFHKEERDEVFKNLTATNLPRNRTLDTTISGMTKQEAGEGGRLFKLMAKSFSKRWQNGEISNFQYLMHLNTLAGRGYNDLTQYPVFPWVLADYESKNLDLNNPASFRQLDKPMGALSPEREEIFRKRYENWDDPEIPKFHYGSHYSSAGIVLFYLIRLPPFSYENMKLQGGQFDHADRLFNSIRDTWSSASHGNTADVKELIPEFFYLPEFLENRQNFDFGVKQSGDKVDDIILPPWANGSAREFIRKHREALESPYVSENLHHWIDLIFGFRQRGQAAVDATNVFYYLTYEGAVDIDSVADPSMKASTLAQINHFGQTPRQLFLKPHPKRKSYQKVPSALIFQNSHLITQQELRKISKSISQIVIHHDRIHVAESNCILKPRSYTKYVVWGFPDNSLRFLSYDQDKLLSTHEGLHDSPIQCAALSQDGRILATGDADGAIAIWRLRKDGLRGQRRLHLQRALCAHSLSITCIAICQPYGLIVSGSKDCTIIFWDLTSMEYVRQLPVLPAPPSAIHINDMTGDVVTAAGTLLAIWSLNGDCLAAVNVSNLVSETILSVTSPHMSDWSETGWYVTGHQSGVIRLWRIDYDNTEIVRLPRRRNASHEAEKNPGAARVLIPPSVHNLEKRGLFTFTGGPPEYILVLHKVLKWHKSPVTAVQLSGDLKQLVSGDTSGHLISWFLADESSKSYAANASQVDVCPWCQSPFKACKPKYYCKNCGRFACEKCCSDFVSLPDLGYSFPVRVCRDCFQFQKSLRSSFSKKELAHDHGNTNHIV